MRGKGIFQRVVAAADKDHPRACGEKRRGDGGGAGVLGSPPRMRGKVCRQPTDQNNFGITPAHAGKRSGRTFFRRPTRDHPRACGEKAHIVCANDKFEGSPPRMRGKVEAAVSLMDDERITPAHAGKSRCCLRPAERPQDHPRACGEKYWAEAFPLAHLGSPPRMRGKA